MSDYREAVVALLGIATAVMGWLYSRRSGLEQAKRELLAIYSEHIAEQDRRLNEQSRLAQLKLDDLDRRLRDCEARWQKWSGGPIG
jgi:hypothetical protein